jgi:Flp pilus assembly protein TadG
MIGLARRLLRDTGATAAVEMALVVPFLLILLFGSVELGNYFMDEHLLVQAVRDGARFAARQSFTNYSSCSGQPGGTVVGDTQNVVMNAYRSGGTLMIPDLSSSNIVLSVSCVSSTDGQDMLGIYRSRFSGTCNGSSANGCAQVVTVNASDVPYRSVLGSLGFSGIGMHLNASSQAVVTGI